MEFKIKKTPKEVVIPDFLILSGNYEVVEYLDGKKECIVGMKKEKGHQFDHVITHYNHYRWVGYWKYLNTFTPEEYRLKYPKTLKDKIRGAFSIK